MCSCKRILQTLTVFLAMILSPLACQAGSAVHFAWAILTDTATGPKPLDFSTIPKLKSGTTLQIYIEQKPGAFIYIYLLDPGGGLTFIYPGNTKHYDTEIPGEKVLRIPPDTARFELMPPAGQEKLYLLASPERLTRLENLTAAYQEKPDDADRRADVLKELKLLHRQYSSMSQKTETSVPVAGTIRTRGTDDSFDAVQVNADSLYSRILRINHD